MKRLFIDVVEFLIAFLAAYLAGSMAYVRK